MNCSNSLKVTVNQRKYLICGINRATSCKDLLCAIAKATQVNNKSDKNLICKSTTVKNKNLLEKLIDDCRNAGDLKSLKVFSSLGKDARIIVKDCIEEETEKHRTQSKKRKHRQKRIHNHHYQNKEHKTHKGHEIKARKKYRNSNIVKGGFSPDSSLSFKKLQNSTDDLMLESYKREKSRNKRKAQSKYFEESDLDLYRSIYNTLADKQANPNRVKVQQKIDKKIAWMNHLKESPHIYYIDEKGHKEVEDIQINTIFSLDDSEETDSGLPSPDFDSSESQNTDTDPLKRKMFVQQNANIEQLFTDQIAYIENELNKNICEHSNQNKVVIENYKSEGCDSFHNILSDKRASLSRVKKDLAVTNTSDVSLDEENDIGLSVSKEIKKNSELNKSGKLMSPLESLNREALNIKKISENIENYADGLLDCNENIAFGVSEKDKMVAVNADMFDKPIVATIKLIQKSKKLEKKKINKKEISQPVLLSPSVFRKHSDLTKIRSGAKADILIKGDNIINTDSSSVCSEDQKETEKKYNSRMKDLRRSFRLKTLTKNKCNEPEYIAKDLFYEMPLEDRGLLEYNVFSKKPKKKANKKVTLKDNLYNPNKNENFQRDTLGNKIKEVLNNEKQYTQNTLKSKLSTRIKQKNSEEKKEKDLIANKPLENITDEMPEVVSIGSDITEVSSTSSNFGNDFVECSSVNTTISSEENTVCQILSEELADIQSSIDSLNIFQNETSRRSSLASDSMLSDKDSTHDISKDERAMLESEYLEEILSLFDQEKRILDLNLFISELCEELELLTNEDECNIAITEQDVLNELGEIKSLLRSVGDLTTYQRKEIADNMNELDKLDLDLRTSKAGYENLRSGGWKMNAHCAPRSLLKHSKFKQKCPVRDNKSSFV